MLWCKNVKFCVVGKSNINVVDKIELKKSAMTQNRNDNDQAVRKIGKHFTTWNDIYKIINQLCEITEQWKKMCKMFDNLVLDQWDWSTNKNPSIKRKNAAWYLIDENFVGNLTENIVVLRKNQTENKEDWLVVLSKAEDKIS